VVLLVSERADFFGGGQRSLLDLAAALQAGARFAPLVVLPEEGPLGAALAAAGVVVRRLPLPAVRGGALFATPRALADLARLAREAGAALLHSDSPRTALYAGTAARLLGRPHLWHVRASVGSSAFADAALLALSDRVVAVSRAAARRSPPLARSSRLSVIPTGIAPPVCLPRREARLLLGLEPEGYVVGVVGRVEPDKGGEEAVASLPLLRLARPEARLVFVGRDTGGSHAERLGEIARSLGLGDAVRFAGPRDAAAPLLSAFDLLIHPSRHEALPRVVLESLHAGVPVVATAVGGVPEAIEDGVCGLLVPPRDPEQLGAASARLASDADFAARLVSAGRERARTRFSLAAMTEALEDLYDRMTSRVARRAQRGRR